MNVLCIIAHPDDEALGLGGTLAKHSIHGDDVYLCVLSNHAAARKLRPEQETFNDQLARSAQTLGILDIKQFDYPNIRMNAVPTLELVQAIESAIIQFTPEVIYTHHGGDLNEDHRIVFAATMAAIRLPERHKREDMPRTQIKEVLTYEVLSSTDWSASNPATMFCPNVFVDITDTIEIKIRAIKKYPETLTISPHPRSLETIRALATVRGSQSGFRYAEAFMLMRGIRS